MIVFSPAGGTALQKVSASGGTPTAATGFQGEETGMRGPLFCRTAGISCTASSSTMRPGRPGLHRLTGRDRRYAADGRRRLDQRHLLARSSAVPARDNPDGAAIRSRPARPLRRAVPGRGADSDVRILRIFSASDSGVLAYQTGTAAGARLSSPGSTAPARFWGRSASPPSTGILHWRRMVGRHW